MPRGGARVNSGPAPDPNALRRDRKSDQGQWRTLPSKCSRKAPAWPLLEDVTRRAKLAVCREALDELDAELDAAETAKQRTAIKKKMADLKQATTVLEFQIAEQARVEREVWRELWKSPHANAWHELGWAREVAQYVRHKVLGEMGSLDDAKEARQWSDRLGLNPAAMLRNRWRVASDEVAARRERRAGPSGGSARDRLRAIGGDAG